MHLGLPQQYIDAFKEVFPRPSDCFLRLCQLKEYRFILRDLSKETIVHLLKKSHDKQDYIEQLTREEKTIQQFEGQVLQSTRSQRDLSYELDYHGFKVEMAQLITWRLFINLRMCRTYNISIIVGQGIHSGYYGPKLGPATEAALELMNEDPELQLHPQEASPGRLCYRHESYLDAYFKSINFSCRYSVYLQEPQNIDPQKNGDKISDLERLWLLPTLNKDQKADRDKLMLETKYFRSKVPLYYGPGSLGLLGSKRLKCSVKSSSAYSGNLDLIILNGNKLGFLTEDENDSSITFIFEEEVEVHAYLIQSYRAPPCYSHLRSWILESCDENNSFSTFDERKDVSDLNFPLAYHVYPLRTPQKCKILRLRQTGPNCRLLNHLAISRFDVFGV